MIGINFPLWLLPQVLKPSCLMMEGKHQVEDLLKILKYHQFLPAQGAVKASWLSKCLFSTMMSKIKELLVNTEESKQLLQWDRGGEKQMKSIFH